MTFVNYPFKEIGTPVKNPEEQKQLTKKEKKAIYQHEYYQKHKEKYKEYVRKFLDKQKKIKKSMLQKQVIQDPAYQKLLKENEELKKRLDLYESLKGIFKRKGIVINDDGSIFIS